MWGSLSFLAVFVRSGTGWEMVIVSAETMNVFKMTLDHHLRNVRRYL